MQLKLSHTPAALSANGLAAAVAWAAGGYALSATTMNDQLGHLVTIAGIAVTDHNAKTFTVTRTDADGIALTEGIAGPNGAVTVTTTKHFKTVTSITVSSTTGADTFNLGWSAVAVSQTICIDWRENSFEVSLGLIITGVINYSIQHCLDNLRGTVAPVSLNWFPHSSLVAKTANADGNYAFPITATRLLINSITAGATIQTYVMQGLTA